MFNRLRHSPSDSEIYRSSVEMDESVADVQSSTIVDNVTVDDCLEVITNYEAYPHYMTIFKSVSVQGSAVEKETGDILYRVCYFVQLPFKSAEYTLCVRRHRENAQHAVIRWHLIDGPFRYNNGSWTLTQIGNSVEAKYALDMAFTFQVPKLIKKWILGKVLENTMKSIKNRIQEHAAHGASFKAANA